jgi:hypothetical protein
MIPQNITGMIPGGSIPMIGSGGGNMEQFNDLQKALQASNYQTDVVAADKVAARWACSRSTRR